jgi:hypothetical protein
MTAEQIALECGRLGRVLALGKDGRKGELSRIEREELSRVAPTVVEVDLLRISVPFQHDMHDQLMVVRRHEHREVRHVDGLLTEYSHAVCRRWVGRMVVGMSGHLVHGGPPV